MATENALSRAGFEGPVLKAEDDRYGYTVIAKGLARSISALDENVSTVIGIEGQWGSGKTSLLNLLTEQLKSQVPANTQIVVFSPWVNSPDESPADKTHSAPKSVSMMILIGGDTRLLDAWNRSVENGMKEVEKLISARITDGGKTDTVLTGNMVAALYNHDTSRALDPQIHTHALVFNTTFAEDKWRALASDTRMKTGFGENLYALQVAIGNLVLQPFRQEAEKLGYETVTAGKNGLWELKDVPVAPFSTRSQAISEAAGPDASKKSRDVAALDTRQAKAWADPDLLKAEWRRRLTDEKFDIDNYIGQAQTRAEPPGPVGGGTEDIRSTGQPDSASSAQISESDVQKAVSDTISALSEKKVQFTWSEMLAGTVSRLPSASGLFEQARAGIDAAIEEQRLIPLDREKGIFTSDIHLLNELSVHQLARTAVQEQTVLIFPERAQEREMPAGDAVSVLTQDKSPVAILSGRGGAQTLRERTEDVAMMARSPVCRSAWCSIAAPSIRW